VITISGNKNASSLGWYFYFDFLECAVATVVPSPTVTTTTVGAATDFDTDNTYKLSPERLVWNIQKLGLLGEIDHYCGVFWWKQAVASNLSYPQCMVTFSGNWNDQDVVWLHVGGSAIGKTVFGGQDHSNTIARHFANFVNAIFDGVWANGHRQRPHDHFTLVFQRLAISRVHRVASVEHRQWQRYCDWRLAGWHVRREVAD